MVEKISTTERQINRCPICQSSFLLVEKIEPDNENFNCPICGVKFRTTLSSDHLMFLSTPINFPGDLVGLWLTRAEIGKALHDYRMIVNNNQLALNNRKRPDATSQENPIRAQAVRMARELVANGKSEDYVHGELANQFQMTDYAIEEILQDAFAVDKARKKIKQTRAIKISIFAFLFFVVILLSIYLFSGLF